MLLEMDKDAIINVIKDDNALDKMIAEALQVCFLFFQKVF
jgi:hypothetical protein